MKNKGFVLFALAFAVSFQVVAAQPLQTLRQKLATQSFVKSAVISSTDEAPCPKTLEIRLTNESSFKVEGWTDFEDVGAPEQSYLTGSVYDPLSMRVTTSFDARTNTFKKVEIETKLAIGDVISRVEAEGNGDLVPRARQSFRSMRVSELLVSVGKRGLQLTLIEKFSKDRFENAQLPELKVIRHCVYEAKGPRV